jgi:hypothetical protein
MFVPVNPSKSWSKWALRAACWSICTAVFFAIAEGLLRSVVAYNPTTNHVAFYSMLAAWAFGFRSIAQMTIEPAVILFVGAKFFEARTVFTVGFDRLDPEKVAFKGPDENNFVWIGHRYGSKFEADVIAAAMQERLKEGAA